MLLVQNEIYDQKCRSCQIQVLLQFNNSEMIAITSTEQEDPVYSRTAQFSQYDNNLPLQTLFQLFFASHGLFFAQWALGWQVSVTCCTTSTTCGRLPFWWCQPLVWYCWFVDSLSCTARCWFLDSGCCFLVSFSNKKTITLWYRQQRKFANIKNNWLLIITKLCSNLKTMTLRTDWSRNTDKNQDEKTNNRL